MILTPSPSMNRQRSQPYSRGLGIFLFASLPLLAQASWPVATPDTAEATNTQSITLPVLQNDMGSGLELIEVNTTTQGLGTASITADKQSVTYQSASGYEGTDTFWYAFTDSEGRTNAAKVTVTVTSGGVVKPIEWPTAGQDSAEATVNTPVEIDVLSNDSGVGLTLTEVDTTTVKLGKAEMSADGKTINYTPPNDYTGSDEFWYVFSDSWGRTNAGKITLQVKEPELHTGWPVATTDRADVINTATVVIPVLDNDLGQNLSLVEVNAYTQRGGRAKIEGRRVRYAPPVDFSGEDAFWYVFTDDQGRTNSAKVTVMVAANTENSTVAFCGVNYSTNGTPEGTFVTQAVIDSETNIGNAYRQRSLPGDGNGNLAVIGDRRYFIEAAQAADSGLTLWMDDGVNRKIIETGDSNLRLRGIKVVEDKLFYQTVIFNQSSTKKLHSHDGVTKRTIPLPPPTGIYSIDRTPYFDLTGVTGNFGSGSHFVKINNNGDGFIRIATRLEGVSEVAMAFSHNGLDYASTSTFGSDNGVITVRNILSQANHYSDPETVINQFPAIVERAVVSHDRLLVVTRPHEDYTILEGSDEHEMSTQYPAKLFTVNTKNEFVELATCDTQE